MSDGLGYTPSSPPIVLDKTPKPKPPIDRTPYFELVGKQGACDLDHDPVRSLTVVLQDAPWTGTLLMYHNCHVQYSLQDGLWWCKYDRSECVVTWS